MAFGPIAPQSPPVPGTAVPGDPEDQSEDCLTLNVWTPALDDARRPVMVWIHGGGFTGGTGASVLYRGQRLAQVGDLVVVTINYRLGALGFLSHPALSDEGPAGSAGSWGLHDQVAALRWVHEHVSQFGGDPGNVTVFGESAGAMSIATLLGVPSARGLFRRAIVESGPPYTHSTRRAQQAAEDLVGRLGIGDVRREVLEQVPADELVRATQAMQDRPQAPGELPLPFLPVVDGEFLPCRPEESVAAGEAADVQLLIGTNRDELSLFGVSDLRLAGMDEQKLANWLQLAAPWLDPNEAIEAYVDVRSARGESTQPHDLWVAMGSDLVFRWPSLQFAAAQKLHQPAVYVYLFMWETPAFGGRLGSCHALEIPFVFGTVRRPEIGAFTGGGPEASVLSDNMLEAWIGFARSGDPSHEGIGGWPEWDPQRQPTMTFGRESGAQDGPRGEELAVLAAAFPLGTPHEATDPAVG